MSGKRDLNFSLYSGRLTHPPEMMQYNTGHGHMLCFSLAIHSDAPSDKIDNPMFLDVKEMCIRDSHQGDPKQLARESHLFAQLAKGTLRLDPPS